MTFPVKQLGAPMRTRVGTGSTGVKLPLLLYYGDNFNSTKKSASLNNCKFNSDFSEDSEYHNELFENK